MSEQRSSRVGIWRWTLLTCSLHSCSTVCLIQFYLWKLLGISSRGLQRRRRLAIHELLFSQNMFISSGQRVMQRQQLRWRNSAINSSRPTQSIFFAGILSARTGWIVRSFSESVQSMQPFIPSEERLLGKLSYCPDLTNVFTLLPVRIDFLSLEAHEHGSWCHASVEK